MRNSIHWLQQLNCFLIHFTYMPKLWNEFICLQKYLQYDAKRLNRRADGDNWDREIRRKRRKLGHKRRIWVQKANFSCSFLAACNMGINDGKVSRCSAKAHSHKKGIFGVFGYQTNHNGSFTSKISEVWKIKKKVRRRHIIAINSQAISTAHWSLICPSSESHFTGAREDFRGTMCIPRNIPEGIKT